MIWTIISTVIVYLWLFAVLTLLWSIWRSSTRHIHHMEQALIDVATKNSQATQTSAEAVQKVVALLERRLNV